MSTQNSLEDSIDVIEEEREPLTNGDHSQHTKFKVRKLAEDENVQRGQERPSDEQVASLLQFEIEDGQNDHNTHTHPLTQNSITAMLSIKFRDIQKKLQHYGVKSPKFRKRLVSKWESLNYDRVENELYWREYNESGSKRQLTRRWLGRWVISFFIGVFTALLAAVLHVIVENVCHVKFSVLSHFLDKCAKEGCMYQAALIWITINFAVTLMGSALIVYLQPMAAGGGIPFLKAYLNGVKIPGFLTLEAFIAKVGGVILAIVGGLAIGKEGPMAHAGGIIGAGLGKGRLRLCRNKQLSDKNL